MPVPWVAQVTGRELLGDHWEAFHRRLGKDEHRAGRLGGKSRAQEAEAEPGVWLNVAAL